MTSPQQAAQSQHDWDPVILAVAPNGARKTKADHPALPMTPDEIAHCAASCVEAGAAMIHLHVRDAKGVHTLDADAYRAAIAAIRDALGDKIVIQATSEAVGVYKPAQQMAMVRDLLPEAVSLSVREIVPDAAHEAEAARFFDWMRKERILPQFILYSADDVARFDDLVARGIVPAGRHLVLFVLGRYTAGQKSEPADVVPFLTANRESRPWSICAFGAREAACAMAAATLGGHVRVGFENNMLLPDGRVAPDNAALIDLAARGVASFGRPVANAAQARELMVSYAWN
jgi:3-keto-5-aminohexanoate cleavage enzyme